MSNATDDKSAAARPTRFAFEYDRSVEDRDRDWFKRFDLFVSGSILPPEVVQEYHAAGTRLFFYEWAVAFYPSEARGDTWHGRLLREHPEWLLDDGSIPLENRAQSHPYYYDAALPALQEARVAHLAGKLEASGYDGVFFDCMNTFPRDAGDSEWPPAMLFARRHPNVSYSASLGHMLSRLRDRVGAGRIFTNQGYRSAPLVLPFVDYDLSESYATTTANAAVIELGDQQFPLTAYQAWHNPESLWGSTRHIIHHCIVAPVASADVETEVLHLNYCYGVPTSPDGELEPDREAIYYSVAAGWLFHHSAYVRCEQAALDPGLNHDEIYFVELGAPQGNRVDVGDELSYRWFESGLVVVNGSGRERAFSTNRHVSLLDVFDGREVSGRSLIIPGNVQLDGSRTPTGRVYMVFDSCLRREVPSAMGEA